VGTGEGRAKQAYLLNDERAEEDDGGRGGRGEEGPEHGDLGPPPNRTPPQDVRALRRHPRLGGRRQDLGRFNILRDRHVLTAPAIGGHRRLHPTGDQASMRGRRPSPDNRSSRIRQSGSVLGRVRVARLDRGALGFGAREAGAAYEAERGNGTGTDSDREKEGGY
jgi:hypothetical protein